MATAAGASRAAAARGGASARGGGAAQDRSRRRRNGHSFPDHLFVQCENWSRPPSEIRDLMGLLRRFIRNDMAELHQNGVKVRVIGERGDLDPDIRRLLEEAEELTRNNIGLTLVVAFNYGARQEIARAAARIAANGQGRYSRSVGDHRRPDRSASRRARPARPGPHHPHQRRATVVQLLLWQAAYSELVFVPTYWPDFDRAALEGAIAEYHRRRTAVRRVDRADWLVAVAGVQPANENPSGCHPWPAAAI